MCYWNLLGSSPKTPHQNRCRIFVSLSAFPSMIQCRNVMMEWWGASGFGSQFIQLDQQMAVTSRFLWEDGWQKQEPIKCTWNRNHHNKSRNKHEIHVALRKAASWRKTLQNSVCKGRNTLVLVGQMPLFRVPVRKQLASWLELNLPSGRPRWQRESPLFLKTPYTSSQRWHKKSSFFVPQFSMATEGNDIHRLTGRWPWCEKPFQGTTWKNPRSVSPSFLYIYIAKTQPIQQSVFGPKLRYTQLRRQKLLSTALPVDHNQIIINKTTNTNTNTGSLCLLVVITRPHAGETPPKVKSSLLICRTCGCYMLSGMCWRHVLCRKSIIWTPNLTTLSHCS